ncbi:hypothetical protein ACI01C_001371 [Cronobacter sakazakii]|uniref:hypothetical protein n=1 Tax=Cronobacter sakazakii TaxID=28141 RepID=UPI000CFD3D99|nr:hypothetical protein [Cronobacter sakazakii]ELY4856915.1 hypothetical protein [Cronobacter sakazakii]NCH13286.1 hypothetical protein [Cronobacter sakazakii]
MAAPENKKGVRQCPKTLQDAFILSGLPAAVGELPGNGCQDLLSKGCARFDGSPWRVRFAYPPYASHLPFVGRVSATHPPSGLHGQAEGKYTRSVNTFRSP